MHHNAPMDPLKRKTLLSLLALPAGCAIQPLGPVRTEPLANPAAAPEIRPAAPGQSWTYQKLNSYNSALVATEQEEVVAVEPRIIIRRKTPAGLVLPEEHHKQWGQVLRDPAWDFVQNYQEPVPVWPQSLAPGSASQLNTHYQLDNFSFPYWISVHTVVKAWERIHLPRGDFNALRIEKMIRLQHSDVTRLETLRMDTIWLVPEIGRWAAREISGQYRMPGKFGNIGYENSFRWELSAWT
jgi:hypothetical protein